MARMRFSVSRFLVSLDAETFRMISDISKRKTMGNSSEAVRVLIRKGYEAFLEAENRPQVSEKTPESAASQANLL